MFSNGEGMRVLTLILFILILSGCASTGYNPHYIVSDATEENLSIPEEPSLPNAF